MNQSQRTFLIKKIEESAKTRTKALEFAKKEYPNLSNYILHEVMSDRFNLQSIEHIKSVIKHMALNTKSNNQWMNEDRWGSSNNKITFNAKDILVIPETFNELKREIEDHNLKLQNEINQINVQSESLIVRIQLASDKTLQTMINEVDDMGNISLMDDKLKLLSAK